jgi:hypothetical protein
MSVLDKLASSMGRRDEVPNQELARELAQTLSAADIRTVAQNLWDPAPAVQADCLKVLYELGYLAPELVAPYAPDFIKLLRQRNNRLVWGAMIALSTIASLSAPEIFPHYDEIVHAMETGSVITMDNGIKTLARLASVGPAYNRQIFPFLLQHLSTCRPKEVPQHAESTLPAVTPENKAQFIAVLEKWMQALPASRLARLRKVLKAAENIGVVPKG